MSTSILREYLVSLGFKVDEPSEKKFGKTLQTLDKRALNLGKSILGVATATQAMVTIFAFQMEKLYYASKLANSTAGSFQALKFAGAQVGVSGETMAAGIVSMNQAIRANPGLIGFLESLGVSTRGRKTPDIFLDFIDATKNYGPEVANQMAAMFGIDAQTLQLLQEGSAEIRKQMALREQMAKSAGVDTEAAAEAGKKYAQVIREITERLGVLKDVASLALLPLFQDMAKEFDGFLVRLTNVIGSIKTLQDLKDRFLLGAKRTLEEYGFGTKPAPTVGDAKPGLLDQAQSVVQGKYEDFMRWGGSKKFASAGAGAGRGYVNPAPVEGQGNEGASSLFARLEAQYGLPAGLLDRVWKQESGRGRNMLSKAGAKGHFQFMDPTATEYGVSDPNDLEDSATGAAKYWQWLLKRSGGDVRTAAAGYNWGIGNVQKYGLGKAPAETRGYMDAIGGASINQEINITVNGAGDANETARAVKEQQASINADLVRNLKPRVQ